MSAPTTGEEFLELVRKSGLVAPEDLAAFARRNEPVPGEPRKLAELLVGAGLLTGFQSGQLLRGKWRGFSLGKYRVLEYLGRGGMGAVYLCEHQALRRRVAVKVLPKVRTADPAALNRFYREARATAVLDHPNLVRAHDMDREGDTHFLVMEYVDGTSLQDLVKWFGPLDV